MDHGDREIMGHGPQIRPSPPHAENDCYRDCAAHNLTADACGDILRTEWCVAEPEPWKQAASCEYGPVVVALR